MSEEEEKSTNSKNKNTNYKNIRSTTTTENLILTIPMKNFQFTLKYDETKLENLINNEDYIIILNDLNNILLKAFYYAYKNKDPSGTYPLTKIIFLTTIILNIVLLCFVKYELFKKFFLHIILIIINVILILFVLIHIYKKQITHLNYTQKTIKKFIDKKLFEINEKIKDKYIEWKFDPFERKLFLFSL